MPLADDGKLVYSAIAYSDALTARFRGEINQGDHLGLVKLLRSTLGNDLPNRQEANLKTLLDQKDEVQNGARLKTREEAERTLARLEEFATWAESRLNG